MQVFLLSRDLALLELSHIAKFTLRDVMPFKILAVVQEKTKKRGI